MLSHGTFSRITQPHNRNADVVLAPLSAESHIIRQSSRKLTSSPHAFLMPMPYVRSLVIIIRGIVNIVGRDSLLSYCLTLFCVATVAKLYT